MIYLLFGLAYLLGSIPTGYLLFRLRENKDIRSYGSKNIGATNVLRVTGWKLALPVAVFDILKGAVPVYLGLKLSPELWIACTAGFLAILGHCFPVYIRFKGGKGVATTVGAYSVLAPYPLLCIIGIFVLIVALTRHASLGSLSAALSFPLFVMLFKGSPPELLIFGGVVFILIMHRHRENIRRLINGNEKKLGKKSI